MHQHDSKYFPIDPLSPNPGVGQKKVEIHLFQNMVMLHIKLKEMTKAAACQHIICPYTHPKLLRWGQGQNNFSDSSQVALSN